MQQGFPERTPHAQGKQARKGKRQSARLRNADDGDCGRGHTSDAAGAEQLGLIGIADAVHQERIRATGIRRWKRQTRARVDEEE